MKKIFGFIFIFLSFYLFFCFITKNTNLLNTILFNNNITENSKRVNKTLKQINKVVVSKTKKDVIDLLSIEDNKISLVKISSAKPLVYIYNTHDKENYFNDDKSINITYDVKVASYILQELLEEYNVLSIVEDRSPTSEVNKNKLDYSYTYSYSRNYLQEAINNYPSIKIFIDLHRDGVEKSISTVNINDKNYAKLMFFLGMGHENSDKNKKLVNNLENIIKKDYPELLRDTFIRQNDSYNQDLSPDSFLIEVGGNYNTIFEVSNSLDVLAYAIAKYLGKI